MFFKILNALLDTLDELLAMHNPLEVFLKHFLAMTGAIQVKLYRGFHEALINISQKITYCWALSLMVV